MNVKDYNRLFHDFSCLTSTHRLQNNNKKEIQKKKVLDTIQVNRTIQCKFIKELRIQEDKKESFIASEDESSNNNLKREEQESFDDSFSCGSFFKDMKLQSMVHDEKYFPTPVVSKNKLQKRVLTTCQTKKTSDFGRPKQISYNTTKYTNK